MQIDILQELAQVVNRHKIKEINILDSNNIADSKLNDLYNYLLEADIPETSKISKKLGYSSANSSAFKKLALRLKDKLLNTSFFIDTNKPSYTDYQQAYYSAYKEWAAIKILRGKGAIKTPIYLTKILLSKCISYEFVDLIIHLCEFLCNYYAVLNFDNSKYKRYNNLLTNAKIEYTQELEAQQIYNNLIIRTHNSKIDKQKLLLDEQHNINRINTLIQKNSNFSFKYYAFQYLFYLYNFTEKIDLSIKVASEAIKFLEKKPYDHKSAKYTFYKNSILNQISKGIYEPALEQINKLDEIVIANSGNFYYVRLLNIIVLLKSSNFKQASHILKETKKTREFKNIPSTYTEYYSIIEGYLSLFDKEIDKNFKIFKFLNEVPKFSREKEATNISILILHFIFLIKQRKYDRAIDRVDALNQYTYRYIKKDENYRSHCFIKALIQITKGGFHPKRARRYSKKYIDKMDQIPVAQTVQSIDVEIVNYNKLYNYIFELL